MDPTTHLSALPSYMHLDLSYHDRGNTRGFEPRQFDLAIQKTSPRVILINLHTLQDRYSSQTNIHLRDVVHTFEDAPKEQDENLSWAILDQ
jgi:hypothetical protein